MRPSVGHSRDLRLLQGILQGLRSPRRVQLNLDQYCVPVVKRKAFSLSRTNGAKTKTTRKMIDLQQGTIQAEPLPELESDSAPQYPTVVQGARNNMVKFSNCIVLTRVGNFYELYFDQAEQYGPLLNLKVASKKTNAGPVAMAGFPFFQLDRFLKILVQDLNKYVAISEEFPTSLTGKVKSGGLLFDRRVARVITPGTLIDEKFLDPYENNFLLALHVERSTDDAVGGTGDLKTSANTASTDVDVGLAWLDLSTGDFFTQTATKGLLLSALARIGAREIILDDSIPQALKEELQLVLGYDHHLLTFYKCANEFQSMTDWDDMLESPLPVGTDGDFTRVEKSAGHCLLDYVRNRLQGLQMKLQPPRQRKLQEFLGIDRSTLRGLEILETARDGLGKGSLLHAVRRTTTKSGARLLRDRLTSPSASLAEVNHRLELVSTFYDNADLRDELVQYLGRTFDVQRLVQKFALNKGDADDMICLSRAIESTSEICSKLQAVSTSFDTSMTVPEVKRKTYQSCISDILRRVQLQGPVELARQILRAIDEEGLSQKHRLEEEEDAGVAALAQEVVLGSNRAEDVELLPKKLRPNGRSVEQRDPAADIEEPWIMRRDASDSLQRLHDDLDSLRQEKVELARSLREKLSVPSLTLRWTPGLGHICHIKAGTKSSGASLESLNARVVSSTKSTRSFYLTDWSRLGSRLDQAKLHIRNEEQRMFALLRQEVIRNLIKLRRNAAVMDEIDVACSFAILAHEQSFVRPLLNTGTYHKVVGGRHPTVKLGLEEQGKSFVSNDLFLGDRERLWLVTGPNMAGKSTFLRQNALISILAQVGSYVPAEHAEIGLVDQIFSRIGAADDLFRDQSTFMVEMLETAAILKQATPRSFVIMDEVGRGTTPEDGTAVGYACLHHLHYTNKCRTLFATHFHALADMTHDFEHLARYCTDVLEDESGSFSFVHRLRSGVNRQSHALKVARLAGLPEPVLDIANDVLRQLMAAKHNVHLDHEHLPEIDRTIAAAG